MIPKSGTRFSEKDHAQNKIQAIVTVRIPYAPIVGFPGFPGFPGLPGLRRSGINLS
jgi:hypothetical protein